MIARNRSVILVLIGNMSSSSFISSKLHLSFLWYLPKFCKNKEKFNEHQIRLLSMLLTFRLHKYIIIQNVDLYQRLYSQHFYYVLKRGHLLCAILKGSEYSVPFGTKNRLLRLVEAILELLRVASEKGNRGNRQTEIKNQLEWGLIGRQTIHDISWKTLIKSADKFFCFARKTKSLFTMSTVFLFYRI